MVNEKAQEELHLVAAEERRRAEEDVRQNSDSSREMSQVPSSPPSTLSGDANSCTLPILVEHGSLRSTTDPGTGNTNTEKTTKWALNTFNSWRVSRGAENESGGRNSIPELTDASTEELNYWLAQFVRECKQKDGRDYKHQNLYAMMCGLARHIKKNRPNFNILDNPGMVDFKSTLQEVIKRLQVKQAHLCTVPGAKLNRRQWDSLWEQGLLGESDPAALFHAVYFLFVTVTGLTSAVQLRSLTTRNVVVTSDPQSNNIVTTYYPNGYNKITQICKSDRVAIRCMETDRNNPRSFGRLLELYLSKLPPHSLDLWVRPSWRTYRSDYKNKGWYGGQPVGQNLLRTTVKSVCELASFVGNYSNQSLDRELLNWEHYNVEHLPAPPIDCKEIAELVCSGVKREYVQETIPQVTVKTHLTASPTSTPAATVPTSKRLRTSISLTEQLFNSAGTSPTDDHPATFLSLGLSNYPDISSHDASLSPGDGATPSKSYTLNSGYPSEIDVLSVPQEVISTSHDDRKSRNTEGGEHSNPRNYDAAGTEKDGETKISNNSDANGSNNKMDDDLRDVHVDIPEHVDKCLGLFKDCTIQNVTINIYLSKTGENGR